MEAHDHLADNEFEKQFELCQLDPAIFSHEAHLRLAWIHINKYGIEKAEKNIQRQLQNFVTHVGAVDKYHKTLTIVGIRAVHHFMKQSDATNFKDFIRAYPQLKSDFRSLVNSHYSFDIFCSQHAKTHYRAPDLQPFVPDHK